MLGFGMDSLGQADTSEKRLKAGEGPHSRRFGFLEWCKMFTLAGSLPLPSGVLLPGGKSVGGGTATLLADLLSAEAFHQPASSRAFHLYCPDH